MIKEYKGFKYEKVPGGWRIYLPTGTRLRAVEQSEDQIKVHIDALIAAAI